MSTREKFESWAIEKRFAFRDKNGLWPMGGATLSGLRAAWDASRREALMDAHSAARRCITVRDAEDAIRALAKDGGE
jgi:hypothetical protein